jgi:hypothetical protein
MVPLLLAPKSCCGGIRLQKIWMLSITSISHPTVSGVVAILLVIKTFTYKLGKVPAEKFPVL